MERTDEREPIGSVWWGGPVLSDGTWCIWRCGEWTIEYTERDGYSLTRKGFFSTFETFEEAAEYADQQEGQV